MLRQRVYRMGSIMPGMVIPKLSCWLPGRGWLVVLFSCVVSMFGSLAVAQSDGEKIHIPVVVQGTKLEEPVDYFTTLLIMALNASKADNEVIDIVFSERDYAQARWIHLAQTDTRNFVIWTMTDKEREQQLRPIRIPLCKGLFSYRVLVIRNGDQQRFSDIHTLEDLSHLRAGQGTHWPDTPVMQHNGLPVVTAETTESLFRMINAKRFDYFPRGVSEAWFELDYRKEKNLLVENNLLLYYPTSLYFFVNKKNEALAQRIENGLEILIDNGKFDEFFYSHPRVTSGLARLANRRIITLENPSLPEQLKIGNPRYWIDISDIDAASPSSDPQEKQLEEKQ